MADIEERNVEVGVEDSEEEIDVGAPEAGDEGLSKVQNRQEKKARKAIQKLGLKPVTGVTRITVKRSKNMLFVIANPDVYKSAVSDTYVIFGEAKMEDLSQNAAMQAAQQFRAAKGAAAAAGGDEEEAMPELVATKGEVVEEEDEEADDTGLDQGDIEMVQAQANVSRAKAINALRKHDGDIVNAIMALTT
ncbi:NAC-A/B domain-containing protein [Plasmodiophora brassicae]|uniref:NAC-A/B domain-containing protein n=1 Tax=Plasmodiophora brassicae TaxID=37360 RepID=A0A0G4IWZ8_PLABS|nr:hypothetical protein PBRA_007352 [Plasmodiophora brassicae]SPQ98045.1 unnamed protein product [Plasmodiophora brassicae]